MRFIHTSDWHLGRAFGPLSLESDQREFLAWLVETVARERADLVVIAGDIYDRAIAPTDSLVLFRDTLRQIRDTGARVVAITGNHDGADRVSPYDTLVDASGVYIRGGFTRPGEVIRLEFADGPLDVVAIPFLEPQMAPDDFDRPGETGDDPDDPDGSGDRSTRRRRRTHQSVLQRAVELARPELGAPRSLAVAHAFVAGGAVSESERQLTVGGTGQVDPAVFHGFSYVALGHLHRPQSVGADHLRYSGTPLAYSFSEVQPKSVTLVELDPRGVCEITPIPVPVGRGVLTVTGSIAELCASIPDQRNPSPFVRAVVTDPGVVLDAKARLSKTYPSVVEIELRPQRGSDSTSRPVVDRRTVHPVDAARQFWLETITTAPSPAEDALLVEAFTHAENRER